MSVCCKFCGEEFSNLQDLVNRDCRNHPNGNYSGRHQAFAGSSSNRFYCKFCGKEFSNLQDLVNRDCRNHPNGNYSSKHEPL